MRLVQMPDSSPSTRSSGAPGSPRRAAQTRAAEMPRPSEGGRAAEATMAAGAEAPPCAEGRAGEAALAASAPGGGRWDIA
eukprot:4170824-Prymnesium_polylepis.1